MNKKEIILVDEKDKQIGVGEKLKVHREGKLHRSFSIFVFNSHGELLLHKRAKEKYHSGSLWSNTCCSHPRPNRDITEEAQKRLVEEMGIKTSLKEIFSFTYKTKVGDLIEHEFDHVFFGKFDAQPKPNPKEVEDWQWVKPEELKKDIEKAPEKYTPWLKIVFDRVLKKINQGGHFLT